MFGFVGFDVFFDEVFDLHGDGSFLGFCDVFDFEEVLFLHSQGELSFVSCQCDHSF